MSVLEEMQKFIADAQAGGGTLVRLETEPEIVELIRKELKIPKGEVVKVDGVLLEVLGERQACIAKAILYARLRWNLKLTDRDAEGLLKAVPTEELMPLIPLVMDQHFDSHDSLVDPVEMMPASDVDKMVGELRGLGFVDVKV